MISNELKDILNLAGGRYIVVENGKPAYIVMDFNEYRNAILDRKSIQALTEEELVDKINTDIALWREGQNEQENQTIGEIEDLDEVEYV